jgi:murein DD-endopeptidase MepM/ murein hydrolase activator NlpD
MRGGLVAAGAVCAVAMAASLAGRGQAALPAPSSTPLDPALALAALDRKIADLDAEEQSDKAELSRMGGEVALCHVRAVARGRAFFKLTRAGLLPVGGGFDALVSHAMRVERDRRVLAADVEEESRLRGRAAQLARDLERVARDRVALAGQRTAMDAARLAMEDEQRRTAAFDKAFETSTGAASDYVAVYGGNGAVAESSGEFASARGRLLFPVAGRAEVRPAHRDGTDGPGLEIRAPVGSAVRAVFAGKVAFADRYGPYGRIVILDHGDHYYTVSGNLDEVDVKIGQNVGAGERIGTVGDEGQGAMLYFEVRHGAQTIAPGGWLGL